MDIETYNAIYGYRDQLINMLSTVDGLFIALYYSHTDTTDAIISIAHAAGLRVTKRIIAKGTPDAEVHLTIR